ncbi:hypothetical protein [Sideroxydans lithotrophicus]|uniref:hypothetical protein n=1 Tax=Sideroxydans lithotrophicus TaxID=63745 RepID=UPI00167F9FFA|nr:hypothetical protein [Sideroxydans lithotrophicus]
MTLVIKIPAGFYHCRNAAPRRNWPNEHRGCLRTQRHRYWRAGQAWGCGTYPIVVAFALPAQNIIATLRQLPGIIGYTARLIFRFTEARLQCCRETGFIRLVIQGDKA